LRARARLRTLGDTQRFIIRNANVLDVVKFGEIDWIEAGDYYSTLHVGSRTHMLRRSLSDLDAVLAAHGFSRIHRSAIVNRDRIRSLAMCGDGEYEVVLHDGRRLRMSRRYRKPLLELLGSAA